MNDNNVSLTQTLSEFTRQYLLDNLEDDFYASDFSKKHVESLLNVLIEEFGEEKTLSRMSTISTSIYSHFKNFAQECEVIVHGQTIKVVNKLQDGIKHPEVNKAFINLNVALTKLMKEKDNFLLQAHLVCFPQENLSSLNEKFIGTKIADDASTLRSAIRQVVNECFKLCDRDIVLFLRKKLYIRYFVDMRSLVKTDNKRFMGVDPEQLEAIYKDYFPEDFENILLEMAPDVINDTLNFCEIKNLSFKRKYIEVFRTLVDVAMSEYTSSLSEEEVMALNGYVLRLHFDSLLYLCASMLIEKVMQRDRKADMFLRFYNGETVTDNNGKKIKKPFVIDVKENIWNYNSIFSVMTQHAQFKVNYKQQLSSVKEAESHLDKVEKSIASTKSSLQQCTQDISLLQVEISKCTNQKDSLLNKDKLSKEEEAQLRAARHEEKGLLKKYEDTFSQKNTHSLNLENMRITQGHRQKQLKIVNGVLTRMEKKGEELSTQKHNILVALAKALSFR